MSARGLWNPIKVGLTGSIGMGKSTVSKHFRYLGFPVFDADETVHRLYSKGGRAVEPIQAVFPDAVVDGAIDRTILSRIVLSDPQSLNQLESIIHPLVSLERNHFYEQHSSNHNFLIVYDIPLLMKHPEKHNVDYSIVVTASTETQKQRVMSRPGMTLEKFHGILTKQVPDEIQRNLADYVINTDYPGFSEAKSQLANILNEIILKNEFQWNEWISPPQNNLPAEGQMIKSFRSIFDLVIFDIDDTLLPVMGPVMEAHQAQMHFFSSVLDPSSLEYLRRHLTTEIRRLEISNSHISHNYTELRSHALSNLLTQMNKQEHHTMAMEVYTSSRDNIHHHLYDDVLPCFQWIAHEEQVKIALLSNSTVNITSTNEIASYISLALNSSDIGAPKPSPITYLAVLQRMNVRPSRVLFIGDNFECDISGPANLGMRTAHLCRHLLTEERLRAQQYPDGAIRPDLLLKSLSIIEIKEKISQKYLS